MNVNLKDFILNGEWGSIKLGMTRNEILNKIGEPEDWLSNVKNKNSSVIWRYGNIEFYFGMSGIKENKDKLEMIFTDYLTNINGGNTFDIDKWFFKKYKNNKVPKHLQLKKIKKIFYKNKISFKLAEKKYNDFKQFELTSKSGVKLTFDRNCLENNFISDINEDKLYYAISLCISL